MIPAADCVGRELRRDHELAVVHLRHFLDHVSLFIHAMDRLT